MGTDCVQMRGRVLGICTYGVGYHVRRQCQMYVGAGVISLWSLDFGSSELQLPQTHKGTKAMCLYLCE